jgi:hypothetical protein
MLFRDALLKPNFIKIQAISVDTIYEFESGKLWEEGRGLIDFHKINTTNAKPASVRGNSCTYIKIPLYVFLNTSSNTVSLSAGTFNQ